MWPIYVIPGFVTERQNDSLCLSVIKQILAELRVAPHGWGHCASAVISSCRGPSMRGISLVCGCIYTLYMYIAGRRYICIYMYKYIYGWAEK